MSATTQDIFIRANDLLGEFGHCTGAFARDEQGRPLDNWNDPRAASFCAMGVIGRAALDLGITSLSFTYGEAVRTLHQVVGVPEGASVTEWNDRIASEQEVRDTFAQLAGATESVPSEQMELVTA